jgi:hypothetical protein
MGGAVPSVPFNGERLDVIKTSINRHEMTGDARTQSQRASASRNGILASVELPSLRFDGETDEDFRLRAERVARIAQVLVTACLKNRCMQTYIADPNLPILTVESVLRNPTVRVEYEQAIAFGGIGECLAATAGKNWGKGPSVLPLEPADWFYPDRITYRFKENSLYNRRFEQRRRLKQLLGKNRKLVGDAKASTRADFLKYLTKEQANAIRRILGVGPGAFWRAAKGKTFLFLPPEFVQGQLDFGDEIDSTG